MAKHRPTIVWPTRPLGSYPQQYVRTADDENLELSFHVEHRDGWAVKLSRRDARMLARRINQCLDETLSRPSRAPDQGR